MHGANVEQDNSMEGPMASANAENTTTVIGACPHDCPDTCSMLITVEDGRAIDVRGNPEHPFTRGGLCVKVNNYTDRVYSPERVLYPLKRSGPKGSGQFMRLSWEEALNEIKMRWRAIIDTYGPTAILPYSYLGTGGILNGLNVGDPFFNKLGATISERTYCDSGSCTAYSMTIGATAGVDPESIVHSRYIVIWACNMISTNLHLWPIVAEAQRRGAKVVVIDPVRHRTARHADWYLPIRPGTDGALALAMMNVIIGEGLTDEAYVRDYAVGYDELAERVKQYTPEWASEQTGIPADDIRTLAREYATSQPSMIRIGVAIERHAGGGAAGRRRAAAAAVVGVPGELARPAPRRAGHTRDPGGQPVPAGPGAHRGAGPGPAGHRADGVQLQPGGGLPGTGQGHRGPVPGGPVHRGQRAFPDRHRPLRRPRAAGHHAAGAARHHVQLGPLLRHAEHPGHRAGRRGHLQHRAVPAPSRPDGVHRGMLHPHRRADDG